MCRVIFLLITFALCCNGRSLYQQQKWGYLPGWPGAPKYPTEYKMAPPSPPPSEDYSVTVDAIDSEVDTHNNQEVGIEIDYMQRLSQFMDAYDAQFKMAPPPPPPAEDHSLTVDAYATQDKLAPPPPPPPPSEDNSVTVDANDSEAVVDTGNNQEVGTEIDDMQRLLQIVPDDFAVNLEPCGVFYLHLEANAIYYFIENNPGVKVYYFIENNPDVEVGYVAANGTTCILTNLEQGNTFAVPNLLHWFINKSCLESASKLHFYNIDRVRPDTQAGSIPEEILKASMGEQLASQIARNGDSTKLNSLDMRGRCPICMRDCGLY